MQTKIAVSSQDDSPMQYFRHMTWEEGESTFQQNGK